MTHLVKAAFRKAGLYIAHQIYPQGDLGAVEGRLLDDALGTIGDIGGDDIVGLISGIAQEVALEDSLCATELAFDKLAIGIENGFQLLGIREARRVDVDHRMVLDNLCSVIELENFCKCVFKMICLLFVHNPLFFFCAVVNPTINER